MAVDAGGLVEALVAIHKPTKTWSLGAHLDNCDQCHSTWPCPTLLLVCEALGQEPPPQQMTACDGAVDTGDGFTSCMLDRDHEGNCKDEVGRSNPFVHMKDALMIRWIDGQSGDDDE